MNQEANAIYVELDCLQDTRIATLAKIDQELASRTLRNGYHTRLSDEFDGVSHEDFKRLYQSRDVQTLMLSAPTEIHTLILRLIEIQDKAAVELNSPYRSERVSVVVNTYPYQLSEVELTEIGKALVVRLSQQTSVTLVHLSPTELTPAYVKANFNSMVMYDFDTWLSEHFAVDPEKCNMESVFKSLLHGVTVFAPAIYHQKPSDEELEREVKEVAHPFVAIEMLARTIIGLELIDVAPFCVVRPTRPA